MVAGLGWLTIRCGRPGRPRVASGWWSGARGRVAGSGNGGGLGVVVPGSVCGAGRLVGWLVAGCAGWWGAGLGMGAGRWLLDVVRAGVRAPAGCLPVAWPPGFFCSCFSCLVRGFVCWDAGVCVVSLCVCVWERIGLVMAFRMVSGSGLLRRGALGLAGLAVAGGVVAGPAVVQSGVVADAGVSAAVAAGKPDKGQPSREKLVPHGVQGAQSRIALGEEQTRNVREIVSATKRAGMDERAAVVAVATALQESKLVNLGHLGERNDHDSQGLFQQRPSSGWGSVEQITDPQYATTAFLRALRKVDGWRDMPLTEAAQRVQVSAYPFHYAQWEQQAADLVAEHWNDS